MARPKKSPQVRPTRSDVQGYYKLLKEKAQGGDVNAAGWLLVNATQEKQVNAGATK